jgi:acetyl-CoA carboxylase carboxyl transferase subunit beta
MQKGFPIVLFGKSKYTLVSIKKKNIPDGLFAKCPDCQAPTYTKSLKDNLNVCPQCGYHFSLTARERLDLLIDPGTFE